jgi:hypothetical protein
MQIGGYNSNMQNYIDRILTESVKQRLKSMPAAAILGPRQCGKSTLAKKIIEGFNDAMYIDLERPSDSSKLRDPEAFFRLNKGKIICLDEIQRAPELFPVLRSIIDAEDRNGQLIILGSASPELIKQSSETLAGRIAYLELTPFLLGEVAASQSTAALRELWLRGGYPRSYLAGDNQASFSWRFDFIRTFLERDIPQLGFQIPAKKLERFWQMCAHVHGQLLNSSKLGESLGVSNHTIRSYIDILDHTFVLRVLQPYAANLKKRLVKSPKIYIRDSGLLHALLAIESHNDLLGHPVYGASWEGFVLENIISSLPQWKAGFYRTASGSELDLVLEKGQRRVAVECKASTSPEVTKQFWNALRDLDIKDAWIVAPVEKQYTIAEHTTVAPIRTVVDALKRM